MAGRTSVGVGVGVTLTLVSVAALALFITTVVFYSQRQAATRKFNELSQTVNEFVLEAERTRDDVQQIKSAATKERASVVGYLINQRQNAMQTVTGSKATTVDDLKKALASAGGEGATSLMQVLRDTQQQLSSEKTSREQAEAARERALLDRTNEVARVKAIEDNHKATLAALNQQVDAYKGEVDQYRAELEKAKAEMIQHEEKAKADAEDRIAALNAQLSDMQKELLLSRDTMSRLQNELKGRTFKPQDEFALVDGKIIGLDTAENAVYINLGRRQKLRLGMSFEVYSEATAIRPDERTGQYPAGKASLEVIKVDENSSTARVVREKKGNPISKGDVIANAVYDPNKVYTFLVYGNFDANLDGIATAQEQVDIRALIESWGGKVTDELAGNVDFLVLGQKPVIPPPPPSGSPAVVIQEYMRVRRISERYDELFKKASETSIPVLNENRLYTLIGKPFGI
jgi:hypothetical protein